MKTSSDNFVYDRNTWNAYIKAFDLDVYYEYDYLSLDCKPDDTPELFMYSDQNRTMLYPYVCRKIEGTSYFDTVTAYGYGGPVDARTSLRSQVYLPRILQVAFDHH
jgi:hypothetical protein